MELTEAMARLSGLKIDWVGEVDWGQIPEAIQSNKIDAFCSGMANDAARAKRLLLTVPFSYWSFGVIVRSDDNRFPPGGTIPLLLLNNNKFRTAYTEGDVLETIVKTELPLVKGMPLPPLGTPADNLMHVITKKTDFVVFPRVMFQSFEKVNPGKIRYLEVVPSLRTYGNVIALGREEIYLQQMLNSAISELVNGGTYDTIMKKYEIDYPGSFFRVAKPYEVAK